MLLILTSDKDLTADFLIVELINRGLPYFRLNAEELTTADFVAIDISQVILGMFDRDDCLLVCKGDSAVPPRCRRGVFGLFQESRAEYPDRIRALAESYAYLRETLHGILFLFKRPKRESFNYSLEQLLVWNHSLMDKAGAAEISEQIERALPLYKKGEE